MCTRSTESRLEAASLPPSSLEGSETEDEGGQTGGEPPLPVSGRSLLMQRLLGLRRCSRRLSPSVRRKRQMTPEDKKDATYWDKRRKNNEAAKRSRERRRFSDFMLEGQLLSLSEENARLRAEVLRLQCHFGLADPQVSSQRPPPGSSKPGLWGLRANAEDLLGDPEGLRQLLQGSRLSRAALYQGNGTALNQRGLPGYLSSTRSTASPVHYPESHHSLQRHFFLQQQQLEKPGFGPEGRFQKAQQQPSGRAAAAEPGAAENRERYSSKETPEDHEFHTCSKSSCLSLPQSRFLPGMINPLMYGGGGGGSSSSTNPSRSNNSSSSSSSSSTNPSRSNNSSSSTNPSRSNNSSSSSSSSILLPWGTSGLCLPSFYYNAAICQPLESSKMLPQDLVPQNLKRRTEAYSAELAHLRTADAWRAAHTKASVAVPAAPDPLFSHDSVASLRLVSYRPSGE